MADAMLFGVGFIDFALLMGWYVVHYERLDQKRREQLNRACDDSARDEGRFEHVPVTGAEH